MSTIARRRQPRHAESDRRSDDKVTSAVEQYLEAIYAIAAERKVVIGARLAEHLRVSAPSITQTLQRLVRDGHVEMTVAGDRKEVRLTATGLAIGEAACRKHRLIERWLQSELKLTSTAAHEAAHALEPGFDEDLLDRLNQSLGRPLTCPHGNPIPGNSVITHEGFYLDEAKPGDIVIVGRITEEAEADLDLIAYLERNQVFPEMRLDIIAVDRVTGAVTARTTNGTEIRIEQRSAALIYIRGYA